MKFLYEYRTKDNERREGVVDAADRDAAFALLKSRATPAQIESLWQSRNERLRRLGIKLLAMPTK